jgi:formylmethanofuran dehydrogenase subunit B
MSACPNCGGDDLARVCTTCGSYTDTGKTMTKGNAIRLAAAALIGSAKYQDREEDAGLRSRALLRAKELADGLEPDCAAEYAAVEVYKVAMKGESGT